MNVVKEQIEALLWEAEGNTLDFKEAQYPFANATDLQKSELLKDILAFTNAFRRTDAFILIGVREVKGGRSVVLGVSDQLEDAHLQQFVMGLTQRPIAFSYQPAQHDGLPIGIIHVPQQFRPIYAKRDFGKVRKNAVYLRRGSSTGIATIEEIARMGADSLAPASTQPELELLLFDRTTMEAIGTTLDIASTRLDVPEANEIPDFEEEQRGMLAFVIERARPEYWRELARYTRIMHLVRPLTFAVRNKGNVTAHDVRLVFEVADPEEKYQIMDSSDLPKRPSPKTGVLNPSFDLAHLSGLHASSVRVDRHGNRWKVVCSFGKIQPQQTAVLGGDLFVGAVASGLLALETSLFADNLSQPETGTIGIRFEIAGRAVTVDELEQVENDRFFATPEGIALLTKHSVVRAGSVEPPA